MTQALPLLKLPTETTIQFRRRVGLCIRCGADRGASHLKTCSACTEAERERTKGRAPQLRASNSARREARKAAGLCVWCGMVPSTNGTYCAACYEKDTVQRRARQNNSYQLRDAAGVCVHCGDPRDVFGNKLCSYCASIAAKANETFREREGNVTYQSRREGHLCLTCATDLTAFPDHHEPWCPSCHTKTVEARRIYRKARYNRLKAEGKCTMCQDPLGPGDVALCKRCRDNHKSIDRKHRASRNIEHDANGRCRYCAQPRWGTSTSCQYHVIDASVRNFVTDKTTREALIEHLEDLYVTQGGLCAYTGVKLEPGKTASIEHIYPRTTHPGLAAEPTNLVWVSSQANTAKLNMSPDDPRLDTFMLPAVLARIRDLASKVHRPA